jgi:uncharacterized membrane protein YfcA
MPLETVLFVAATFVAALVTGVAGFAFGLIAAAVWLHVLTPLQVTTLIVAFGLIVQGYSVWKLRHAIKLHRLLPLLIGSIVGVPVGVALLRWAPTADLKIGVGVLLILFSLYSLARPQFSKVTAGGRLADGGVGVLNGILGGTIGFAGIVATIWCTMRGWPKDEQRAIFQPTGVAVFLATALLLGGTGSIDRDTVRLFLIGLPALLVGTWLGLRLYGKLDEATFRRVVLGLLLVSGLTLVAPLGVRTAFGAEPLQLESKIALGPVAGRIDHFAYDAARQRLFVAELGNNSVGIVDLKAGKVAGRLQGLSEPQGVAWHEPSQTLWIANAGDGSVRVYQGDLRPAGAVALGDDADNIRLDRGRDRIVVGYGKGGLAMIDPSTRRKTGDIALKGHPESFQLDEQGQRVFVNVPDARQIAVVDIGQGKQTGSLDLGGARSNFPMAVDGEAHHLLVVTRSPAQLMVFATADGKAVASVKTCSDSDDLFVDARRQRVYVTCGEGVIEVFARRGNAYDSIGRVPTVAGARTSLFVADTDRLYVAVRASGSEPAAIWVFRPLP